MSSIFEGYDNNEKKIIPNEDNVKKKELPLTNALKEYDRLNDSQLRNSVNEGAKLNSERSARIVDMQGKTGLHADFLSKNLEDIEAQQRENNFNPEDFRKTSPKYAEWLDKNPNNVAATYDDIKDMNILERMYRYTADEVERNSLTVELSDIGTAAFNGTVTKEQRARQKEIEHIHANTKDYGIDNFFLQAPSKLIGQAPIIGEILVEGAKLGVEVGAKAIKATHGPGALLFAAPLSFKIGMGLAAAKLEGSLAYLEYEAIVDKDGNRLPMETAKGAATIVGGINGALESLSLNVVAKNIPGLRALTTGGMKSLMKQESARSLLTSIGKAIAESTATEGSTEFLQEMMTISGKEILTMTNDGTINTKSTTEILEQIYSPDNLDAMIESGRAGMQVGMAGASLGRAASLKKNIKDIRTAQTRKAFFDAIGNNIKNQKSFEKMPEVMQERVKEIVKDGPVETVYIPVEAWNKYWAEQKADPTEMASEIMGKDSTAYIEALESGADIVMPMEMYATKLAPTDHNEFFQNELKTNPEDMNFRESQEKIEELDKQEALETKQAELAKDVTFEDIKDVDLTNPEDATEFLQTKQRSESIKELLKAEVEGLSKTIQENQGNIDPVVQQRLDVAQDSLKTIEEIDDTLSDVESIEDAINIKENIKQQLLDANIKQDVAEAYATQTQAFYRTTAKRLKTTPQALFDKFGLNVRDMSNATIETAAPTNEIALNQDETKQEKISKDAVLDEDGTTYTLGDVAEANFDIRSEDMLNDLAEGLGDKFGEALEINTIEVLPGQQSQGIGTKILKDIEIIARDQGQDTIVLKAEPLQSQLVGKADPNKITDLINFYQKNGFEIYSQDDKSAIMFKKLDSTNLLQSDEALTKQEFKKQFSKDVVYHATNKEFEEFKLSRGGMFGPGVYVFKNKEEGPLSNFGEKVIPLRVRNRKNIKVQPVVNMNEQEMKELEDILSKLELPTDRLEKILENPESSVSQRFTNRSLLIDAIRKKDGHTDKVVGNQADVILQEQLSELGYTGYDALWNGSPIEVIFDPKNLRHKDAKFDPAQKDSANIFHQSELTEDQKNESLEGTLSRPNYFKSVELIKKKMGNKASVDQVKGLLKDIKAEEKKWLGIDTFLEGKKTVLKEELLTHIEANFPKMEVIVRGGELVSGPSSDGLIVNDGDTIYSIFDDDGNFWSAYADRSNADNEANALEEEHKVEFHVQRGEFNSENPTSIEDADIIDADEGAPAKFKKYTLPGGENYREILYRLPDITDKKTDPFVKEEHFEEENILVHARLSDRTDQEGNKVLFIEEIQSDWHQEGRDVGYAGDETFAPDPELLELAQKYDTFWAEENRLRAAGAKTGRKEEATKQDKELDNLNIERMNVIKEYKKLDLKKRTHINIKNFTKNLEHSGRETAKGKLQLERFKKIDEMFNVEKEVVQTLVPQLTLENFDAPKEVNTVVGDTVRYENIFFEGLKGGRHTPPVKIYKAKRKEYDNKWRWEAYYGSESLGDYATSEEALAGLEEDLKENNLTFIDFKESVIPAEAKEQIDNIKDEIEKIEKQQNSLDKKPVPNAPLKSTWHEFGFKQMIRLAAEQGYDKIGWTTGDQQTDIYEGALQEGVDSLVIDKDGTFKAIKDGKSISTIENATKKKVTEVVGAKAANDLFDVKPDSEGSQTLDSGDIKFGGKFLRIQYDTKIPSFAKKFGKKFGAKVGSLDVDTGRKAKTGLVYVGPNYTIQELEDRKQQALDNDENGEAQFLTNIIGRIELGENFKDVASEVFGNNMAEKFGGKLEELENAPLDLETVHAFDMTDSIKKAALEEGFSFFQKGKTDKLGRILLPKTFGDGKQSATIDLFAKKNLSTFLHESGHLYFEIMGTLAKENNAPQEIKDDYNTLLKFLDVQSKFDVGTEQHEKIARAFEAYLREGKAPSEELRSVFAKFRVWLTNLYKKLKDLNVELTDEVREVFDRMLATQDEIAEAQAKNATMPLFANPEEFGMNEAEAAKYSKLIIEDTQAAEEELLKKYMDELNKEKTKLYKQERSRIKEGVEEDVNSRRVYGVLANLQRGLLPNGEALPEGVTPVKLNKDGLLKSYDKEFLKKLPKPFIYAKKDGIHHDLVADLYGYTSGDEMLTDILNAEKKEDLINRLTDEKMKELHGDLLTDGTAKEEALKAIHNDKRSERLHSELKALSLRQVKNVVKKVGTRVPGRALVKERARLIIESKKVRDIKPIIYQRAEKRASNEAISKLTKGDIEGAFNEKQKELLNHELYREAVKAKERVDKIVNYVSKFNDNKTRARIGKAGGTYLEQIDAIMERFSFKKSTSFKELDRQESLIKWVDSQQKAGYTVDFSDTMLSEAYRKHYKETEYRELIEINDAIKNIEHLARLKNKLLSSKEAREYQVVKDEIIASIEANNKLKPIDEPYDYSPFMKSRIMTKATGFFAAHVKPEFMFTELDGNRALGAVWKNLYLPITKADDTKMDMNRDVVKNMDRIFDVYTDKERNDWYNKKVYIKEINNSINKATMLSMAFNWGNAYNKEAMMEGEGWTEAQVEAVFKHLDKRDWDFAQNIWDYINTFWEASAKLEKDLNGIAPKKVTPLAFENKHGKYAGGYYPIAFDGKRSKRIKDREGLTDIKEMFGGSFTKAATQKGHLKNRQGTGGNKIKLNISVFVDHINNVVHDISHRRALIDVVKLTEDPQIESFIKRALGEKAYDQLRPWLHNIAGEGSTEKAGELEGLLNRARTGATIVNMGWKMTTAIVQFSGYFISSKEIGVKYAAKAIKDVYGNPFKIKDNHKFMTDRSVMMRERASNYDRDIRDSMKSKNVIGALPPALAAIEKALPATNSYFKHIGLMDLAVSMPTWFGAYNQAMDGVIENIEAGNEHKAILYADNIVRITQGSGGPKDLAQIQVGSAYHKMFTMFYSFFSVLHNQFRKVHTQFKQDQDVGELISAITLMWILPALLDDLTLSRGPDEDADQDEWTEWAVTKLTTYPFQSVVLVRDVVNSFSKFGYTMSPVEGAGKAIGKTARAGIQLATGEKEEIKRSDIKNAVLSVGYVTGLPSRQVWITAEYFMDWITGEVDPETIPQGIWEGLVTGKKRK